MAFQSGNKIRKNATERLSEAQIWKMTLRSPLQTAQWRFRLPLHSMPVSEVEIINPVADTVATATFQGADVDWYIKAEDIVLKNKDGHSTGNLQNHNPHEKKEIKNHK